MDVPALDAVLFLHPRNSVVDVVQSVGRVMRKADGKNYGYIILPVAVPADVSPSQALSDNKRFKIVWQVLNALRAHDERFDAHVKAVIGIVYLELLEARRHRRHRCRFRSSLEGGADRSTKALHARHRSIRSEWHLATRPDCRVAEPTYTQRKPATGGST